MGLSIFEKYIDASYFDQVLDKVTNSASAFEQYHALIVLERMVRDLSQDECARLDAALAGRMSAGGRRQIKEGTDRYMVASDIRDEIKKRS